MTLNEVSMRNGVNGVGSVKAISVIVVCAVFLFFFYNGGMRCVFHWFHSPVNERGVFRLYNCGVIKTAGLQVEFLRTGVSIYGSSHGSVNQTRPIFSETFSATFVSFLFSFVT